MAFKAAQHFALHAARRLTTHPAGTCPRTHPILPVLAASVNFGANAAKAAELGVTIARPSIIDFSPGSLRHQLPTAVRELQQAMQRAAASGGRVYVHCTAGLGRAPAVCIAWLYWFQVCGCVNHAVACLRRAVLAADCM